MYSNVSTFATKRLFSILDNMLPILSIIATSLSVNILSTWFIDKFSASWLNYLHWVAAYTQYNIQLSRYYGANNQNRTGILWLGIKCSNHWTMPAYYLLVLLARLELARVAPSVFKTEACCLFRHSSIFNPLIYPKILSFRYQSEYLRGLLSTWCSLWDLNPWLSH